MPIISEPATAYQGGCGRLKGRSARRHYGSDLYRPCTAYGRGKGKRLKSAPFGIVGMETAAALTFTELVKTGYLTPMGMAEKMSTNPARILGINKGDISVGHLADITIFDPKDTYEINAAEFASKGKNMPFEGRKVTGRVVGTILDGRIVYQK